MEYMHNGIRIWVEGDGKFTAFDQSGATVRTNSLKAMKLYLDKKKKEDFKPFTVLVSTRYLEMKPERIPGADLFRYNVVGISHEKGVSKKRARKVLRISCGKHPSIPLSYWSTVITDDPKAIEAYKAARKYQDETDKIMKKRQEHQDKLDAEVDKFKVTPEDVLSKTGGKP